MGVIKMRNTRALQQGMGIGSIMFVIVVVIFFVTVLFKLGPAYMSYMTLRSIMDDVAKSPEPIVGGRAAIVRAVDGRMMINDVRSVDAKSFTVKKSGDDAYELAVDYEQRQHLFFNIDTVLTFHYSVVVKGQ